MDLFLPKVKWLTACSKHDDSFSKLWLTLLSCGYLGDSSTPCTPPVPANNNIVFTLIYMEWPKFNCIDDHLEHDKIISVRIWINQSGFALVKSSSRTTEKSEIDRFVNATDSSPIAYAVETPRGELLSLQSRDHRQLWTLALAGEIHCGCVIHSTDNNNTTVDHLSIEFSHLLRHFLTHGGEMNAKWSSPLIPGSL